MFSAFQTFGRLGAGARAVAAAWSPASLFAAGEAGGLWDFSTLANLYQDSAGTTPCTAVGDPIGLVLDTKNGTPVLGPELVTNGTFDTNTAGWDLSQTVTASLPVWSDSAMRLVSDGTGFSIADQNIATVANKTYSFTLTGTHPGTGAYEVLIGTTQGASDLLINQNITSSGTSAYTFVATGTASWIRIRTGSNNVTGYLVDNISVREIPGNPLTQSTSTKRPILGRMPATGVRNLLVNTATLSTQNVTTVAGSYTIQFTGAGSVTASGTYSGALTNGQTFTCTAGTLTLTVSGSVTNAQLEAGSTATAKQVVGAAYDVTESGVASVYTAYFDGVDDCLVSPSIDFSGTDAMSVFSGFRKTSDAARGMVAELSATTASNNGSFALTAPNAASATIVYESKGTSLTDTSATIAAPADSVISAVSDISADSNVLRRNGAQTDSDTGDQGTGNFGNYPIYVGQRAATSLPYKGFISVLCTRGAATDATTVTSMEKWIAARTPGLTL